MAQIIWTVEAARNLEEISSYISSNNPKTAPQVISGIYEKVQLLRHHPRLGQRYESIADREVREILYGHFRIPYLIKAEGRIEILGVFHTAMEIERYLR